MQYSLSFSCSYGCNYVVLLYRLAVYVAMLRLSTNSASLLKDINLSQLPMTTKLRFANLVISVVDQRWLTLVSFCPHILAAITVDELEQKKNIFLRRIYDLARKQTNCKDVHHLSVLIQFIINKEFVCILELVAVICGVDSVMTLILAIDFCLSDVGLLPVSTSGNSHHEHAAPLGWCWCTI